MRGTHICLEIKEWGKPLLAMTFLAAVLSGCGGKTGLSGPIFFPPPPNEPRIQYLTGITDSTDIEGKKTSFSLVLTGGEKAGVIKKIGKAYGVTAHKGKLYVSASGAKQIDIIDFRNGTFEYLKGNLGKGALKKPVNVAVDDGGNIYVVDTGRKEIVVFDRDGNYVNAFGKGLEKAKLTSVAVYGEYLYVPDFGTSEIRVLDKKTGEQVNSLGKGNDPTTSVVLPTNIAADDKGAIYVTNTGTASVMILDRDGNLLKKIGKMGDSYSEFARPRGVAVDQAGRMYVVDAGHANVQIFNNEGRLLTFFGNPDPKLEAGTLNLPAGIAVSNDNLEYFQKMAAPGFKLENVIFIVNQYGTPTISVFGLGQMEGAKVQTESKQESPDNKGPQKDTEDKEPKQENPGESKQGTEKK